MKLAKTLDLLARPTRFELVTLGLEMGGIEVTNCIELYRFVDLLKLFYNCASKNSLKNYFPAHRKWSARGPKKDKFLSQFCQRKALAFLSIILPLKTKSAFSHFTP